MKQYKYFISYNYTALNCFGNGCTILTTPKPIKDMNDIGLIIQKLKQDKDLEDRDLVIISINKL